MKRVASKVCLIAAWAFVFGVIWQGVALAAAPTIDSLGRIKDDLIVSSRVDVDAAGSVYVVDPRRSQVVKYDQYSKRVAVYDQVTPDGRGLAVSALGDTLYVSSGTRVEVLDAASGAITYLGGEAFSFARIADIDIDDRGFIYVADAGDYAVKVFAPNGIMAYRFGTKGDNPGQFQGINGLAVDSASGRVYVSDTVYTNASAPEVLVFTLSGSLITSFPGATGFGTAKLTFFNGITFDSLGRLYVFDGFMGYMYAYEISGTTLVNQYTYNKVGYLDGQLSGPQDAVFDPSTGRLFVACSNGRIEILGVDGATNPVKVNVAPQVPMPVSPINESVVTVAPTTLRFQNAVDADANDVLSYDVAVFAADDLATPIAQVEGYPQGDTFTDVPVTSQAIVENGRHAWKVRAFDGTEYSAWSDPQYFYLNALAEEPSSPVPVAPLAGDTILDGSGVISWLPSTDADPNAVISYELEICADENFVDMPVYSQVVSDDSVVLGGLDNYNKLLVGSGYFWRVTAVDETGLRSAVSAPGAFLYDTSVLSVSSPISGTLVYLGGDQAYPGRYVGETPLELRDFPAGATTVVAERAGFEPFVAPVEVSLFGKTAVAVSLVPAIAPDDFKARPLVADGQKIALTTGAAPVLSDLNRDGLLDLLVVDASGAATLYAGQGEDYAAGSELLLESPVTDAAPFVVDWNNDGELDLLVGGVDALSLYSAMAGAPAILQSATTALQGESGFVPVVVQMTDDTAKDLLVGTASGQVFLLANTGTDEAPLFEGKQALLKTPFKGGVSPAFVDWDADGQRDLLVAAQGAVYLCAANTEGQYVPVQVLTAGNLNGRKTGGKGKTAQDDTALALGEQVRFVAADLDAGSGKDLVVGNAAGELMAVVSHGAQRVDAYDEALVVKLDELVTAGLDMTEVRASLDADKFDQAAARVEVLLASPGLSEDAASLLADLLALL